jgi:lysine-N-methylase
MSAEAPNLPGRPRLAEHAMVRRHFIDGEEIIVVHDARSGDLVRMPPRAWALVEAADGTRDLGGLLLAASQRGALHRTSEVVSVLTDLHAAGLLTDGIDPFALERREGSVDAGAPLDVLPFTLVCDGSGSCCATYSTVRFTEDEASRARALLPGAAGGRARVFLPLQGSGAQPHGAATAIDGRCAYHAEDGACELHRTHGPRAKPSGCSLYPATFVFDGEAVRVSLGFECACIEKSLGRKDGVPLLPEGASVRGDLPEGAQIATLPEVIELAPGRSAARAEVARWSRAVLRALRPSVAGDAGSPAARDVVATLWSLAAKVADGDLSEAGVALALEDAAAPSPGALSPWIAALAERTAAKRDSADRWRSERDRVRVASHLLADAAGSLGDPATLTSALEPAAVQPSAAAETFYITACIHGHALVGELPLAHALRDRAVRILLARVVPAAAARTGSRDPGRDHPLPLVEAMMRAQGVKEYARGVPA